MRIKIDESVLRKTAVFREILDDANRRKDVAPELAKGLSSEFDDSRPIDAEDCAAVNSFLDLGTCLRGDHVSKHASFKTPDLITGGFSTETADEVVYLAECKFNAENPANFFSNPKSFHDLVSDKFRVVDASVWNIYATEKKFFVLFPHRHAETAKHRFHKLQKESEGEELSVVKLFSVCNLTEFRDCFV